MPEIFADHRVINTATTVARTQCARVAGIHGDILNVHTEAF